MKTIKILGLIAALSMVFACGGDKKGAPSDTDVDKTMNEMMGAVMSMVDVIEKNKDDCKQMATGLEKLFDSKKSLWTKAKDMQSRMTDAQKEKFKKAAEEETMKDSVQAKLMGSMMGMMMGLMKCKDDPGIKAFNKKWKEVAEPS